MLPADSAIRVSHSKFPEKVLDMVELTQIIDIVATRAVGHFVTTLLELGFLRGAQKKVQTAIHTPLLLISGRPLPPQPRLHGNL